MDHSRESSRWVEFVGGPYDGTMTEVFSEYAPEAGGGMIIYEKGTPRRGGVLDRGRALGHYVVEGWQDEDLKIIRMRWDHRVPDELK